MNNTMSVLERAQLVPRTQNWSMAEMAYNSLSSREKVDFLREKLGNERKAPEKILRRAEVADRLSISLRTVDSLAEQGILTKVKLPYRKRAAGFRESQVETLLAESEVGHE